MAIPWKTRLDSLSIILIKDIFGRHIPDPFLEFHMPCSVRLCIPTRVHFELLSMDSMVSTSQRCLTVTTITKHGGSVRPTAELEHSDDLLRSAVWTHRYGRRFFSFETSYSPKSRIYRQSSRVQISDKRSKMRSYEKAAHPANPLPVVQQIRCDHVDTSQAQFMASIGTLLSVQSFIMKR